MLTHHGWQPVAGDSYVATASLALPRLAGSLRSLRSMGGRLVKLQRLCGLLGSF